MFEKAASQIISRGETSSQHTTVESHVEMSGQTYTVIFINKKATDFNMLVGCWISLNFVSEKKLCIGDRIHQSEERSHIINRAR